MCQILGEPVSDKNWWTDEYIEAMALYPKGEGILPVWEETEIIRA
jgi:hypothetical protein